MYSVSFRPATIGTNLFSRTHNLKLLAGVWKSQTTEARPLQNQGSTEIENEIDSNEVRPYEEIPSSPEFKLNLKSMRELYKAYRMTDGFTKAYKLSSDMYGSLGPIYKEASYSPGRMVRVMDPADFEKVFRAEGNYPRRMTVYAWREYYKRRPNVAPNMFNTDGEEWRRIRQSIAPKIMRPKIVEENIENFNAVAKDAIARFVQLKDACGPDGHMPDLELELSRWSTESTGTVAFDSRLGLYENPAQLEALQFIEEVKMFMTLSHKLLVSPFARIAWGIGIDTPTFKKFMKCLDTIGEIGRGFITKKMSELKEMEEKKIDPSGDTQVIPVLTYLLTKKDVTPDEVNALAVELMAGGVDNIANTALWLLYNLARFPHIQEKLYQEVESVLGKDENVTTRHLANLPYLKACMKESQRLTPVVMANTRILSKDVVLSGYHVPAETSIVMDTYCTSRSEKYFKDPMTFKPERWLRENKDENHAFSHLPFGFGIRTCVGLRVVELEMRVFMCKLLQRFRLEYDGHEPLEAYQRLIAVPDKPVKIKFIDRF